MDIKIDEEDLRQAVSEIIAEAVLKEVATDLPEVAKRGALNSEHPVPNSTPCRIPT